MAKARKDRRIDELNPVPFGTRPKVILIGNGMTRSFTKCVKTDQIIQKNFKKSYGYDISKDDSIFTLPFPLQVVVATKDQVSDCLDSLAMNFRTAEIEDRQKQLINHLLAARADAILTTNYSLEIEKTVFKDYSSTKVYKQYRVTQKQNSVQTQFGIFQCTEVPVENNPALWHIHGTALRKDSLVMGQLYYGKLLSEVTKRASEVNKSYRAAQKAEGDYYPLSWVDYFLIGDVYIVGFGIDTSEIDIWWLLSYKKDVFPDSHVYYFDRTIKREKKLLLDCYGVENPSIDYNDDDENEAYLNYYDKVFDYIASK